MPTRNAAITRTQTTNEAQTEAQAEAQTEVLDSGEVGSVLGVVGLGGRVVYMTLDEALARLAALEREGARLTEWQPMETAPRDGTAFRFYDPALIHADFNPWGSVEAVFDGESRFVGADWDGCNDIWRTVFLELTPASRWQPLPGPPDTLT